MRGRVRINNRHTLVIAVALPCLAAGFCFAQTPNDPKAMTELGRKYQNGIDCPRDIGKALLYYKQAAEANEPGAMIALGDLYKEGVCIGRDMKYALSMYQRAAELGSPEAMTRYGDVLPGDEALKWFERAAGKGYGPAMTRMGDLTDDPDWYRKAVAAGDPPAYAKLAERETSEEALKLLRKGAALKDPASMRMLAHRVQPPESTQLWQAAAEAGDGEAMEYYARQCESEGKLGDALMWYTKAAKLGRTRAQFWVANRAGEVEETLRIAAAKAGDPEALFQNGEIEKAANLGHPEALAQLGRYEEAAAKGHPPSLFKVGRVGEAAKAGYPEAMRVYGQSLSDKADGMLWIKRAAEAGDVPSMRLLGLAYRSGAGIAKDPAEGEKWLRAAADKGDADARGALQAPKPVTAIAESRAQERSATKEKKASKQAKVETAAARPERTEASAKVEPSKSEAAQAAPPETPEAKYELARHTKKGREAYRLFKEAAEAGYAPAMIAVGDCHMNARGTWRSEIDAVNWYRRAANAGSAEALELLKKLGKTL